MFFGRSTCLVSHTWRWTVFFGRSTCLVSHGGGPPWMLAFPNSEGKIVDFCAALVADHHKIHNAVGKLSELSVFLGQVHLSCTLWRWTMERPSNGPNDHKVQTQLVAVKSTIVTSVEGRTMTEAAWTHRLACRLSFELLSHERNTPVTFNCRRPSTHKQHKRWSARVAAYIATS
ncbi:hypothetical protein F5B20DRAFT_506107 [Whalleya microplaca]|nr:hypothetical protein F5B20DRAFT_506107 [Whalleya microplaca]